MTSRPFSPVLRRGVTLIEASAGTGKTFALTRLYLAAVLSGISVDRILVVTFTEAATAELRGRLRTLLSRARETALGLPADPEILALVADVRPDHLPFLSRALFDFDRAPVATIHSFCRRLLREYAFEFDAPFTLDLKSSDRSFKKGSVRETWRQRVYQEDPRIVWQISGLFPNGPDSLLRILAPGEIHRPFIFDPALPALDTSRTEFFVAREIWLSTPPEEAVNQMAAWLESRPGSGRNGQVLSRDRERRKRVLERIAELSNPFPFLPAGGDTVDEEIQGLLWRAETDVVGSPGPPVPPALVPLRDYLVAVGRLNISLREAFREDLHRELTFRALKKRERQGVETFDDMIGRVVAGLLGPGGPALCTLLRERFPVAFVDEFQDTDYAQFEIFGRIYSLFSSDSPEGASLVLVGDPKQSIYRFRGADLNAYMEARVAVLKKDPEGLCSLGVNYRSDARHVEAINTLFSRCPDPFLSRDRIAFLPVESYKNHPSDFFDNDASGTPRPPVLFATEPEGEKFSGKDFYEWSAREVLRLLGGEVLLSGAPLRPDDICLLVRTNSHANKMLTALESFGIPAVSYAGGSVLRGEMGFDLEMLLLALKDPGERRQMRLVLSSSLFGVEARELLTLASSPGDWNVRVDPFFRTASDWHSLGAMGALRRLCLETGVFVRILGAGPGRSGRRRLTDLLHLFEIVESLDRDRPPLALLADRYLETRRESEKKGDESTAPRLDTLDGRVRILTIHRAKGLEFPVVILPQGVPGEEEYAEDGGGEDTEGGPEEMMRLLYVALTRAVHRTVVMLPCRYVLQFPVGRLLSRAEESGAKGGEGVRFFREEVTRLISGHPALFGRLPLPDPAQSALPPESPPRVLPARALPRPLPPPLRLESFSSLSQGSRREASPLSPGLRADDDLLWERPAGDPPPGGPLFGTVFHRTFERLLAPLAPGEAGRESRDLTRELPEALDQALEENASGLGVQAESFREVLLPLCQRTLNAGLFPDAKAPEGWFAFEGILSLPRSVEREFLIPVEDLTGRDLVPFLLPEGEALAFDALRGMIRGFVDLLFRHDGKTYLLDYKTNRLPGEREAEAYAPEGLARAMAQHRYDFQGLLYNLALHRLLSFSIPDYDYERHFGGALFLFIRGTGARGEGVVHLRPEKKEIEALSALFSGERR